MLRVPAFDPRTVARDIPGVLDIVFPQLTPSIVAHLNSTAAGEVDPVPEELISLSSLQRSMLFELGYAVGESLIRKQEPDWDSCLATTIARQRHHYDAQVPRTITSDDKNVALLVGNNISSMAQKVAAEKGTDVILAPSIPGFQWISSGHGDFAAKNTLIEVKCTHKRFSTSDYRQVLMYWLLSFAASLESGLAEWDEIALLNPRTGLRVSFTFPFLLDVFSGGRSKIESLELFSVLIGRRDTQ